MIYQKLNAITIPSIKIIKVDVVFYAYFLYNVYLISIEASTLRSPDTAKSSDLGTGNLKGFTALSTTIVYIKWNCSITILDMF